MPRSSGRDQRYLSPLRYPGGKGRLAPYLRRLIEAQRPMPLCYAEPFAGGAGAALTLLAAGVVDDILINDLNPGIAALWRSIFTDSEAFATRIEAEQPSLDGWHEQRAIYDDPAGRDDFQLGYATFFLNRCNRSGILTARPIGGLQQDGPWKIDARFNRVDLAARIRYLGNFRHRVTVSQLDATEFIAVLGDRSDEILAYVDPPYLTQGDQLYLDRLTREDHATLASCLLSSPLRWFMTYDCDARITDELYPGLRCAIFDIKHTAQVQHVGSEYAVYSENLRVPGLGLLPNDLAEWLVV